MFEEIFNQKKMEELQKNLRKNRQTITTAESCTGGLIASMITQISGSSDIFHGGIVSYSNEIKAKELGVSSLNLEKFGAVSSEVVLEMCLGVLEKFNGDFSIAVSGIAGPNGGTKEKPVGTVFIGVGEKNKTPIIKKELFKGDREEIQIQTAKTALFYLYRLVVLKEVL